ncbi:MAG: DNA-3-methyladenine glycosylase, partial [Mariprofundaceae bacterium]|nr:DNA-3-methyladenine glycosylase [Mariprofundaceae bacterium]
RLCQALQVRRPLDGLDLVTSESLWIEPLRKRALPARLIGVGPRIGINSAQEWTDKPLRFWIKNHPFVSGPNVSKQA